MMKKKLITLLLAVSLVVTLTPAMAFADESDGQQDTGQVVQMESREEVDEAVLMQAQEDVGQDVAGYGEEDPEEAALPEKGADVEGEAAPEGLTPQDLEAMADGWQFDSVQNAWQYYSGGTPVQNGMIQIGAGYYLFINTYMQTGLQTFGGAKYYFDPNGQDPRSTAYGSRLTGLQNVPGYGLLYFDPGTGIQLTGWVNVPGRGTCYFDPAKNGIIATGWKDISGDRYYFNTSSGVITKGGPIKIGNHKYYFNASNGKMVKGWQKIGGSRYFFNSNGIMQTGWLTHNGKKYYLTSSGAAKIGLATIKGNRYYFQSDGSMMKNSAVKVKGKLYYFLKNGKGYKKKGWFKGSDGGKRYSLGKGRVQTGKKKIKGTWYQFNSYTGIAKTLGDSFDISIQSVKSQTKYLITVNRAKYEVRVYQGSKNNWTRIKKMSCGVGAPATPTPAGTFVTMSRMQVNAYNLNGTKVRYWYHTQFQSDGNKGIHSGLYYVATGEPYDTALKTNNSQGSVRVGLNDAEWIYYNVPLYTTVYIK